MNYDFYFFQDVQESYELLARDDALHQGLQGQYLEYFESTWIGTPARAAVFQPALWNMYQRTIQDQPRTNNNLGMYNTHSKPFDTSVFFQAGQGFLPNSCLILSI